MSEELTPMNHRELWLQAIATGTVPEWLEPMTHEELWLKAIAQGGGSGGGRFVVTFSYDEGTDTWSADKTFSECVAAWNAGQTLWAFNTGGSSGSFLTLSEVYTDEEEVPTYFAFYVADAEANTISGYGIDAEGVYYYSH